MKRTILVVMWLGACSSDSRMAPIGGAPVCGGDSYALVALTDYMTPGHTAKIKLDTFDLQDAIFGTGEDTALKRIGDTIFVINEFGATDADNIEQRSVKSLQVTQIETSIGKGNDPQDVVVGADGKVYVCELEGPGVAILGGATIDLSALDPDGKPNCVALYQRAGLLYAFLALWDDTMQYKPPRGPGKVAVINETTLGMVATFDLMSQNPAGWVREEPNTQNVLIAAQADFSGMAGGVERVDLDARTSRGMVVTAEALGNRYVSDFVVNADGTAFVSAVDPASTEGQSNLRPFTMAGQVGAPMASGNHSAGLAVDACNHLWVVDRGYGANAPSGVYVYDVATKQLLKGPILTSLPPRFWGGIVFIP